MIFSAKLSIEFSGNNKYIGNLGAAKTQLYESNSQHDGKNNNQKQQHCAVSAYVGLEEYVEDHISRHYLRLAAWDLSRMMRI